MTREVRLFCAIACWSVWMGGSTFYFGVVIPTGGSILGGSEQGFVTQQVTYWLNLIGVATIAILFWNAIAAKSRLLIATLSVITACHVALFLMHSRLDALIDVKARHIIDTAGFHVMHEAYEAVFTLQWVAGIVHLFGLVQCAGRSKPLH